MWLHMKITWGALSTVDGPISSVLLFSWNGTWALAVL